MERAGQRLSGPLTPVVAALTSTIVYTKGNTSNKKVRLKKIMWNNRNAAAGALRVGYITLAGAFVQVLPDIFMIGGGVDGTYAEPDLPLCGNDPDGFIANTTLVTGTLGDIAVQSTVAAAAPNDVQVRVEVEEE